MLHPGFAGFNTLSHTSAPAQQRLVLATPPPIARSHSPKMVTMTESDVSTVQQYLSRIEFPGSAPDSPLPPPTLDTLVSICRCHAANIPFENLLFVHHTLKGTARPVDQASLHKRIVARRRGGMCQEMNALLLHNLKLLGFHGYAGLAAMVVDGTLQPASQPLQGLVSSDNLGSTQQCFGSHFIALVRVDGHTYLCDVGAGPKGLAEPVLLRAYDDTDSSSSPTQQPPPADWLEQQGESQQYGLRYRLRRGIMGSAEPLPAAAALTHPEQDSFVGYYLQYFVKGAWRDMYWFALAPVTNTVLQACSDFSFKQHPLFTKHMIVSRVVPDGRVQLYDMVLTTRRAGQPAEEQHLQSEQERDAVLQDVFGLDLSLPAVPL